MKTRKQISIFAAILLVHFFFLIFIQNNLFPIHFDPKKLFVLDLIGKTFIIPQWLFYILELGNLILLWIISKRIFGNYSLILPLIYAISPWGSYLAAAGSFYIYLLFLVLLGLYGFILLKSKKFMGSILVSGTIILLGYSSISFLFLIPIIFILPVFKLISFKDLKYSLIIISILILPLLFLIQKNNIGFRNILNNETKIFSDPGLLNMINSYQGAARQENLGGLAKISENKYLFSLENLILKYTKQLVPSNFFTSQEKLLNFSFTPPIFLGFLIPFVYGFYHLLKFPQIKLILLSTLLVTPSVLSRYAVDLNRLIIFSPVVMIIISYGLIGLIKQKKRIIKLFLYISIFFVAFQLIVVLNDIQIREKDRFTKYYELERNFEVGKQ